MLVIKEFVIVVSVKWPKKKIVWKLPKKSKFKES